MIRHRQKMSNFIVTFVSLDRYVQSAEFHFLTISIWCITAPSSKKIRQMSLNSMEYICAKVLGNIIQFFNNRIFDFSQVFSGKILRSNAPFKLISNAFYITFKSRSEMSKLFRHSLTIWALVQSGIIEIQAKKWLLH